MKRCIFVRRAAFDWKWSGPDRTIPVMYRRVRCGGSGRCFVKHHEAILVGDPERTGATRRARATVMLAP